MWDSTDVLQSSIKTMPQVSLYSCRDSFVPVIWVPQVVLHEGPRQACSTDLFMTQPCWWQRHTSTQIPNPVFFHSLPKLPKEISSHTLPLEKSLDGQCVQAPWSCGEMPLRAEASLRSLLHSAIEISLNSEERLTSVSAGFRFCCFFWEWQM